MKYLVTTLTLILFLYSCSKKDEEILSLLKELKIQNDELKSQVLSMQKSSDSILLILNKNNASLSQIDKKIDSIKIQLSSVLSEINSLSLQLTQTNINIVDIQKRISDLKLKCDELYKLLNSYLNNNINTLQFNKVYNSETFNIVNGSSLSEYFLVIRNGVLRSSDTGKNWSATNWTATNSTPLLSTSFPGASFSALNGGQLLVASNESGFQISYNNGLSFTRTGPSGFGINSFIATSLRNGSFISGIFGSARGIYKSSGVNNTTWTPKWTGRDPQDFSIYRDTVLFSVYSENLDAGGAILKSINSGETWTNVFQTNIGLYDCEVIQDSISWFDRSGNMFITNLNNPNYNVAPRNRFTTLQTLPTANYSSLPVIKAFYFSPKDYLIVATESGLYISANHGITWTNYKLPNVIRYENILAIGDKLFVCTDNGLYVSKI
jgi:hypothetical protein